MPDYQCWRELTGDVGDPSAYGKVDLERNLTIAFKTVKILKVKSHSEQKRFIQDFFKAANSDCAAAVYSFNAALENRIDPISLDYLKGVLRNYWKAGKNEPYSPTSGEPADSPGVAPQDEKLDLSKPSALTNLRSQEPGEPGNSAPLEAEMSTCHKSTPRRTDPGWVKFWRSIIDHWTFQDPRHWPFKVFAYLIFKAARETTIIYRFGQKIVISRGEIDCTERQLAEIFNVSRPSMNRFISLLEENGEVARRFIMRKKGEPGPVPIAEPGPEPIAEPIKTTIPVIGFSVIKLLKYDTYQSSERRTSHKEDEPIAEPGPVPIAEPGPEPLNKNKEEYKNKEISLPPLPPTEEKQKSHPLLTPLIACQIWNENCGPLRKTTTYRVASYLSSVEDVVSYFNLQFSTNGHGPASHLKDLVCHCAATVHPSHYKYITLSWISKKIERVDELTMTDTYHKPFKEGFENGRGTKRSERSLKGSREALKGQVFDPSRLPAKPA